MAAVRSLGEFHSFAENEMSKQLKHSDASGFSSSFSRFRFYFRQQVKRIRRSRVFFIILYFPFSASRCCAENKSKTLFVVNHFVFGIAHDA